MSDGSAPACSSRWLLDPPAGSFLGPSACSLLLVRGRDAATLRLLAWIGLLPALAVLAQLGFRLAYYGEWVPNTAFVKLGFGLVRLRHGLYYLIGGLGSLLPLVVLAGGLAMTVRRDGQADRRIRFIAVPVLLWCGYLIAIGATQRAWRPHVIALGLA